MFITTRRKFFTPFLQLKKNHGAHKNIENNTKKFEADTQMIL